MTKNSPFWAVLALYAAVESQNIDNTQKYYWKHVQLPLIDLRIHYGTLESHRLAIFRKSLKKCPALPK